MIPSYFIKLDNVKFITPLKAEIKFTDETTAIVPYSSSQLKGKKCYIIIVDEVKCLIFKTKEYYYMIEADVVSGVDLDVFI